MPSEEVTEKTEIALELVAALEGDELARFYHYCRTSLEEE